MWRGPQHPDVNRGSRRRRVGRAARRTMAGRCAMSLVAGIDSSTQACKVVVRDAGSGALVREGRARHPEGTEVDPAAWDAALGEALARAGGLDEVAHAAAGGPR